MRRGSPGVVGDAAAQAPDNAAEAHPNVVTLLLPPLNLLATMQNSSEEEGNTSTRPTQARLTSQIMLNWAPHLTAAANGISNRSTTLNQLHQMQRIPAKVAAPTSILGDDMPDNEGADASPNKCVTFKWAPPAWITCLSSLQHDTVMTFSLRLVDIVVLSIPRYRPLTGPQCFCNCGRFVLDALGVTTRTHALNTVDPPKRTRAHFVRFRKVFQAGRFHHAPPQRHL